MSKHEGTVVGPLETVHFENGVDVTLQEDGRLIAIGVARGSRGLIVRPRSDNAVSIELETRGTRPTKKAE